VFKAKYLKGFWVACLLLGLVLSASSATIATEEKGNGPVKFWGTVSEAEQYGEMVCYGSYYVRVTVDKVLEDPENLLQDVETVEVCYRKSLDLQPGEKVEVYGFYWGGPCPFQYCGRVVASGNFSYIVRIYKGYLFKTLQLWCSKSEGPLYLLQTQDIGLALKGFYVLIYKEHYPWEPDPALEILMHKSVLVKGELVKPEIEIEMGQGYTVKYPIPIILVKEIEEISSSERCGS